MRYSFIAENKPSTLSMEKACTCLSVSRSGYFKHLKVQRNQDKLTEQEAVKAFHLHKEMYGYRKVYHYLQQSDISCSLEQVRRLLRQQGLRARKARPFKPVTTKTDPHNSSFSERVFQVGKTRLTELNQVWGSDITYLKAVEGKFLYLAVFLDFYSRKIVGWDLSSSLSGQLVLRAFYGAVKTRFVRKGLIIHSDRGCQYTAGEFKRKLEELDFVQSMSRTGNCYDNAYCESCFSLLKRELGPKVYGSINEARRDVFEWIEGWYNTHRLHSSLGYKSPVEFEKMTIDKGENTP